jgi:hypothetical protein
MTRGGQGVDYAGKGHEWYVWLEELVREGCEAFCYGSTQDWTQWCNRVKRAADVFALAMSRGQFDTQRWELFINAPRDPRIPNWDDQETREIRVQCRGALAREIQRASKRLVDVTSRKDQESFMVGPVVGDDWIRFGEMM